MTIDERFELIDDAHGQGGFGKVSKRKDKALDRLVAVKELHLLSDPEARVRFDREAKALARMSHPHVPAIYDIQFNSDQMYILFEFIDGKQLRDLIGSAPPPLEKVRRWFTQIAAALDHANARGIIHRDVKPENIIISEDLENATLVDFGIALSADDSRSLTKSGYVIGTPAYMSPEQSRGDELDTRSDIYSLGITLYETLSGHLPHAGAYQSISETNEAIPPAFDVLIKECIQQEKNARLETAQEFIRRIHSALRTDVPLSSLLTEARLHEVAAALRQMSAEDFSGKPRGQKLLLINRLKDLLCVNKPELNIGTAEVIALLTRLARFEAEREYRPVISAAFQWGFEKMYAPNWQGNQEIRETIIETSKLANQGAHKIISSEFVEYLKDKTLEDLPHWSSHDLRLLVVALLANVSCGSEEADLLADLYDRINEATH